MSSKPDAGPPTRPRAGVWLALGYGLVGALAGMLTAFLVPTGPRVGVAAGAAPTGAGPVSAAAPAAAVTGSTGTGTVLSLGVLLALVLCLGLGLAARISTGERLLALAPVSGWLIVALLALSNIRGDILLPAGGIEPSIWFLYSGVIGGVLSLLPTVRARRGATREDH